MYIVIGTNAVHSKSRPIKGPKNPLANTLSVQPSKPAVCGQRSLEKGVVHVSTGLAVIQASKRLNEDQPSRPQVALDTPRASALGYACGGGPAGFGWPATAPRPPLTDALELCRDICMSEGEGQHKPSSASKRDKFFRWSETQVCTWVGSVKTGS